jgi:hypothetical protein
LTGEEGGGAAGGWAETDRHKKAKTGTDHQQRCILRIFNLHVPNGGTKANVVLKRQDCNEAGDANQDESPALRRFVP